MKLPSTDLRDISVMAKLRYTKRITEFPLSFNRCFTAHRRSGHLFKLVDQARYHRQPAIPEFGIPGVQPERLEQFGIMLGAAGGEHRQIAIGKAALRLFVDGVERVHQTIAERIGVDVERRMDEVRDVHPEVLVARADIDGRAEALALHAEPDFADAF